MGTNKEKFDKITKTTKSGLLDDIDYRVANRGWLQKSNRIAAKVLATLKEMGWDKTFLAEEMSLSQDYVDSMLSGNENFTLQTMVELEELLDITILSDFTIEDSLYKNIIEYCELNKIGDVKGFINKMLKEKFTTEKYGDLNSTKNVPYLANEEVFNTVEELLETTIKLKKMMVKQEKGWSENITQKEDDNNESTIEESQVDIVKTTISDKNDVEEDLDGYTLNINKPKKTRRLR